ncbi:importin-alpha export receptor [Saitoella coloradoensis]
MESIASFLLQSLNPATAKQAEQQLKAAESQPGFSLLLLQIVASGADNGTRQAAALYFKNFVRTNWADDDDKKISESDRGSIKREIIGLMISVPPLLQVQLGEAVSIIADTDFPHNWDTLIDDLVSRLSPDDMVRNNGVLQTAHSIFKRWRSQFRTDELFTEIKFVLDRFCVPYLQLFTRVDELISSTTDRAALAMLFQTLHIIVKIFFDLNCQDIPEFFEDNMPQCMGLMHKYLTYANPVLNTDDDEEAGPVEKVKAGICEVVELYTQRYEEEFSQLPEFVNTTWSLLTTTGLEAKYDLLVSRAMAFLTSVVKVQRHSALFSSEDVLRQFVEKIILPNMSLREADEELFEDDPIEFIRRDLEGSDSDTRRRSATDLVRGLMEQFEKSVTSVVTQYITFYLDQYAADRASNWKSKDTAVYLLTAIAAKGVVSQLGVTSTNMMVDVVDFFTKNIAPDLTASFDEVHPILKVDAIKYIYTFRNQLTKEQLVSIFPILVNHLQSPNYVVYTYTAITIERILFLKRQNAMLFNKADIQPFAKDLLEQLFRLIEQADTPQKLAENDFLMRAVMRVIITSRDNIVALTSMTIEHLTKILIEISKNPSNPRFNHFVFESLGALIRFVVPTSPAALSQFEALLFPPFHAILGQDVTEFIPYVFQLMSQLLEAHAAGDLPDSYKVLLAPLLTPALWDSRGNIPPLVRLLQAFLLRGGNVVVENNQLQGILGIFQKLVASKLNDHYGFDLLETVFASVPVAALQPFVKQIFLLLLTRLNSSKTEKFTLRFVVFVYYLAGLQKEGAGPDFVVASIDSVQPGLFGQLMQAILLGDAQKVKGNAERKICALGMTRFLSDSTALHSEPYQKIWMPLLTALLKLFELPMEESKGDDEIEEVDVEDVTFQASYSRLGTAGKTKADPFAAVPEPKRFLAEQLTKVDAASGGQIVATIKSGLPADAQVVLKGYGMSL